VTFTTAARALQSSAVIIGYRAGKYTFSLNWIGVNNITENYCRQFYRDALPLIGTTASVSVMRNLIASQQATSKEIDIWLTSLAFIKNPTRDMMRELKVRNLDTDTCLFRYYICYIISVFNAKLSCISTQCPH